MAAPPQGLGRREGCRWPPSPTGGSNCSCKSASTLSNCEMRSNSGLTAAAPDGGRAEIGLTSTSELSRRG
jgi:hypothetical protein